MVIFIAKSKCNVRLEEPINRIKLRTFVLDHRKRYKSSHRIVRYGFMKLNSD